MIDLTIDGIPENQAILDNLGGIEIFREPMEESLAILHDPMARYPSQPARTKYRRTGNYGRTWTEQITTSGNNITGVLGNNARDKRGRAYGPFVGDDERQAHQNSHWSTDVEVMRDNESEIRARFDRKLQNVANGER